jgi:predicted Zn-dependent peptidase
LRKLFLSGAKTNASTNYFRTCYFVDGLTEQLGDMLRAMVPMCLDDEIDPEIAEMERGVIIQELRRHELNDEVRREVNKAIFPDNPEIHHGVGGSKFTLRTMPFDALRGFADDYYTAGNSALFVAGGVTWQQVASLLGGIKIKADEGEVPKLILPTLRLVRASFERESFVDSVQVFFEGTRDCDELAALDVARSLLGPAPLGLLHQRLRTNDRSVYSVKLFASWFEKSIAIDVGTTPQRFNGVEEAIFQESARLANLDYPQELFDCEMAGRRMAWEKSKDDSSNRSWVDFLQSSWLDDDYADSLEASLKVTREQVSEVVRKYFRRDRYGCLHIFKKRDW